MSWIYNKGKTRTLTLSKQHIKNNEQNAKNNLASAETAKGMQQAANNNFNYVPSSEMANLVQGRTYNLGKMPFVEGSVYSNQARKHLENKIYNLGPSPSSSAGNIQNGTSGGSGVADSKIANSLEKTNITNNKLISVLEKLERLVGGTGPAQSRNGGGGDGPPPNFWELLRSPRDGSNRFGMIGQIGNAIGRIGNAAVDLGLNYQQQMATAPVETYSNLAALKGFQQKRFLRDFSDFSAEARILRNPALAQGSYDPGNLINRLGQIDRIAEKTTRDKDTAETNIELKNISKTIAESAGRGAMRAAENSAVPNAKAIAIGAAAETAATAAEIAAQAPKNAIMMRNELNKNVMSDLYLKNRSAFDTQNLMQTISALEEASLQNKQIDIANLRKYDETVAGRYAGMQRGRFYDVLAEDSDTVIEAEKFEARSGQRMTSEDKLLRNRKYIREGNLPFSNELIQMGINPASEGGSSIISQLSSLGGAGAAAPTGKNAEQLKTFRKLSQSGLGPVEELMGQAGILARLSGGRGIGENTEKFKKVMSEAVAIGMNNSELRQAYTENVASMMAQTKTTDVNAISALVQNMQRTGGGNLVDYERVKAGINELDKVKMQNVGVGAYARENMANVLNKANAALTPNLQLSEEQKSVSLHALTRKMNIKDFSLLRSAVAAYAEGGEEAIKNATPAIRSLLTPLKREQAKALLNEETISNAETAEAASKLVMTQEAFESKFGKISDIRKLSKDKQEELFRQMSTRAETVEGVNAGAVIDLIKLRSDQNVVSGSAINEDRIKKARDTIAVAREKAVTDYTQAVFGKPVSLSEQGIQNFNKTGNMMDFANQVIASEKTSQHAKNAAKTLQAISVGPYAEQFKQYMDAKAQNKTVDPSLYIGTKGELAKAEAAMNLLKTENVENLSQTPLTTAERAQGALNEADAESLGKAFANAFFERMERRGSSGSEELIGASITK